jgi:hypothetical protein
LPEIDLFMRRGCVETIEPRFIRYGDKEADHESSRRVSLGAKLRRSEEAQRRYACFSPEAVK